MAYKIYFKKSVSKDLKKIDISSADRILKKIQSILPDRAEDFPELKGNFSGLRKFRVGNYRVIFSIIDDSVIILHIQHRKDVYRK